MRIRTWRGRVAQLGSVGAAALTVSLLVTSGSASAATVPSGYPRWFVGAPHQVRDAGSDTTFFMIQKLSDLYEQSGLFGCTLSKTPTPNYSTCNTAGDIATTDTVDNYDRNEIITGIDQIGSGEGQKQLCGVDTSPFQVDFARSSKPVDPTVSCNGAMVGMGYAKDAADPVDFPRLEGPNTAAGSFWGSQVVGPVASGWIPGDAVTCDTGAAGTSSNPLNTKNGCSGVPFSDMSNTGGTTSIAWRLYCSTDTTPGAPDQKITDWGQLTNVTGTTPVGNGTPIGIPVTIVGVNSSSGTEATFAHFVDSGQVGGTGSDLCGNTNTNQSSLMGGTQALENDVSQLSDFATAPGIFGTDSGSTLTADQDAFVQTALYYISNGVYQSNAYAKSVTVNGLGTVSLKMTENGGISATTANLLSNTYPSARTLYNIYNSQTLRASTAGFLNWICDSNNVFTKAKDLQTGKNYDAEITTVVQNNYGFIRLNDLTASPNNSCQLINIPPSVTDGAENGTTTLTSPSNGFAQAGQTPVQVGDQVSGSGILAGTYVSSVGAGGGSITISQAATQTASGVTLTFNIHDPTS